MKIELSKEKLIPKNTPYCYDYILDYKACCYYKYIDGIEGFCELLKCEVTDQVKECGINTYEGDGEI